MVSLVLLNIRVSFGVESMVFNCFSVFLMVVFSVIIMNCGFVVCRVCGFRLFGLFFRISCILVCVSVLCRCLCVVLGWVSRVMVGVGWVLFMDMGDF